MSRGFMQRFQTCQLLEQQQAAARAHLERERSKFGMRADRVTIHPAARVRSRQAGENRR